MPAHPPQTAIAHFAQNLAAITAKSGVRTIAVPGGIALPDAWQHVPH
jgi:hypothetical protein